MVVISHGTHAGGLHDQPHPTLTHREAHVRHVDGPSPGRDPHDAATASTASGAGPFATTESCWSAPSALGGMKIAPIAPSATCPRSGTTQDPHTAPMTSKDVCSTKAAMSSAGISSALAVAQVKGMCMSALAAATQLMEPKTAPAASVLSACLLSRAVMPYNAGGWNDLLITLNIVHKYPNLTDQLRHGFRVRAPSITCTFTPPNNPSITAHHVTFNEMLHKEFSKHWYIGPFTQDVLEALIGLFQSSPLNIIPKPGKPGKYHLIQNLSYPNSPRPNEPPSINSQVDSALFPCKWGTFDTTCTLIQSLPQGSQGVMRDVAEAYRTVPLHPSQWPALVMRISDEPPLFAVDTCLCFGYGPSAGTYGTIHDAGLDVL